MNKRFLGVLSFAFIVALLASLVLYRVLANRTPTTQAGPATANQVVLAAKDLEVGSVIKEEDVKLADWPGAVPVGATTQVKDIIGRGVITAIYAKEPIIGTRLAPPGGGGGLPAMIPPGMRAMAVRVNEVVGVAGFVVPGVHVDVLVSGSSPNGGNMGTQTQTLLQNIEVLSAAQDFKKDAEGKPIAVQVINLLVDPTQAEQLSLAQSQMQIQLVLRNPLDHETVKTPGTAMAHLFGGRPMPPAQAYTSGGGEGRPPRPVRAAKKAPETAEAAPAPKEVPFVMEIISGREKKEQKFGGSSPEVK